MRRTTYWCLQSMAASICCFSTLAFAELVNNAPRLTLAQALFDGGFGDWAVTALVSLSFGMVSLLQRFRRSEAGTAFGLFIAAHMSGSLISGVTAYLLTQGSFDSPNRFTQALAIGAAGWGGSALADIVAARYRAVFEKG